MGTERKREKNSGLEETKEENIVNMWGKCREESRVCLWEESQWLKSKGAELF